MKPSGLAATPAPRISVVVVFLNAGAFLREAIASVRAQSFTDWELVLVDDGSTDESTPIAQAAAARDPRIRYLEHAGHANLGVAATRNVGLDAARGAYLLFLDGDDVLFTHALATLEARLAATPQAAAVFGTALWWHWAPEFADRQDHAQSYGRRVGLQPPPRFLAAMVANEDLHPANCSSLFRIQALRDAGGFDAAFPGMYEDTVLLAKLLLKHRVLLVDETLSAYRMHPASQCHTAAAQGSYDRARPNADRGRYLRWLEQRIRGRRTGDLGLRWALAWQLKRYDSPWFLRLTRSHKLGVLASRWRTAVDRTARTEVRAGRNAAAAAALAQALSACERLGPG